MLSMIVKERIRMNRLRRICSRRADFRENYRRSRAKMYEHQFGVNQLRAGVALPDIHFGFLRTIDDRTDPSGAKHPVNLPGGIAYIAPGRFLHSE